MRLTGQAFDNLVQAEQTLLTEFRAPHAPLVSPKPCHHSSPDVECYANQTARPAQIRLSRLPKNRVEPPPP